jgi:hypothetical protein
VLLGDLRQRHAGTAILDDLRTIQVEPRTPDLAALQPCPTHACPNSFDDQTSFQFGDGADDHDDCSTKRSIGVDCFTLTEELNSESVQFVEHLQEMLRGTRQPVARPHDHHIESMSAGIVHHPVESRSPRPRTAISVVGILADDLESLIRCELAKVD